MVMCLVLQYIRIKTTHGYEVWGDPDTLKEIENNYCAKRTCFQCLKITSVETIQIELNMLPLGLLIKNWSCIKLL